MLAEQKIETLIEFLRDTVAEYHPLALASSFSIEDMVLTDVILSHVPQIEIFTLDTGRLPGETYDLMQHVRERYGNVVRVYTPATASLENFVNEHGPNAFYHSVELRKRCCQIRKLEPLARALAGKAGWITGLRREQSVTRQGIEAREWDELHGIYKFNPLLDWSEQDVWAYIRRFEVPYNKLHDQGYPSIGCAPCTRAVSVGEDIRAGRWWWENPESKECGLHAARLVNKD